MTNLKHKSKKKLTKIKDYFSTGMLVLAPTAITIWVIVWVFVWFDNILGKWYIKLFDALGFHTTHIPGIGAFTLAVMLTFVGYFVRRQAGKKAFQIWDELVSRMPVIRKIYSAIRQLSDAFSGESGMVFMRPVIVEYPRKGLFSLGFITKLCEGSFCDTIGKDIRCVYIPTTPNPTSGMIIYLPESEIVQLDMTVEDAMKIVITAGAVSPDFNLVSPEKMNAASDNKSGSV